MTNPLEMLDTFAERHFTLPRTKKRDAFWFRLSRAADHSLLWFALGLVRFVFVQEWQDLLRFVLVMGAESGLTNGPIKYCFRRTRPHERDDTYEKGEPLPYGMRMPVTSSFPSGHAAAAMCAACLLSSSHHMVAFFVFPLGLLVAYSRMYTRMHHLSDVLGGLALGLFYGYLACRFINFN